MVVAPLFSKRWQPETVDADRPFSSSNRLCGFFLAALRKLFFPTRKYLCVSCFMHYDPLSALDMLFGLSFTLCLSPWRSDNAQERQRKELPCSTFASAHQCLHPSYVKGGLKWSFQITLFRATHTTELSGSYWTETLSLRFPARGPSSSNSSVLSRLDFNLKDDFRKALCR